MTKQFIEQNIGKDLYLYLHNFIMDKSGRCDYVITDNKSEAEKKSPNYFKLKIERIEKVPEHCKYRCTKHSVFNQQELIKEWIENGKDEKIKNLLGIVECP